MKEPSDSKKTSGIRSAVILPLFDPAPSLVDFARELSAGGISVLIAVDDGSPGSSSEVFSALEGIAGCAVCRHKIRQGRGAALRTGFEYCVRHFEGDYTVIAAGYDGQYGADDVLRIAEESSADRGAMIVGSRDVRKNRESVMMKADSSFIGFMLNVLYGIRLVDIWSGLRGFPSSTLPGMLALSGSNSDHGIRMLIEARRTGLQIREVPVGTGCVYRTETPRPYSKREFVRILSALAGGLGKYFTSSTVSAATDVLIFFTISTYLFHTLPAAVHTLIAVTVARVVSSSINYTLNNRYVFAGSGKSSAMKYYVLWAGQLASSYGLAFTFGDILGFPKTPAKVVIDIFLAVASYQIQRRWVFRHAEERPRITGAYFEFIRGLLRMSSVRYAYDGSGRPVSCIFICRHMDAHGPLVTLKWLPFTVRPMIFHMFLTMRKCYRQYYDFTFTERMRMPRPLAAVCAFLAAALMAPLARSSGAVPVYRDSFSIVSTMRASLAALLRGESIIVYPDIDYTADADTPSDIYHGFLCIEVLYRKATGRHLDFVPLVIDDLRRTIHAMPTVRFRDEVDFYDDEKRVADEIRSAIWNPRSPV